MVAKWNKTINLVSEISIAHLWTRHIVDSAQLFAFRPAGAQNWADLGSGGGFPGLVIAAMAADHASDCKITLIESDQRKSVFLREAARAMNMHVQVIAARVEAAPPQSSDVLTARALAPLPRLLALTTRHLNPRGVAIFPKGEGVLAEIAQAQAAGWRFDFDQHKSVTDPSATILTIRNISFDSTQ